MQHDEKSPFFSELCTSYSSIRRTHTHTHTAGGDCRAPTGEKKKSGVVESLQVKKKKRPYLLNFFCLPSTGICCMTIDLTFILSAKPF